MSRRWETALVVVLLLVGACVRTKVAHGWVYAGSDSYGYLKLADELRLDGRYALGPSPAPVYWARAPLYPLYLAAIVHRHASRSWWEKPSEKDNWDRIKYGQIFLDVLGTGLAAWWLTRRLAGRISALVALALLMVCPFTLVFTSVALTETIAIFLTTLVLALIVGAESRPRLRFAVAGALVGLAQLLRAESVLLALVFIPALLALRVAWRERLWCGLSALAGFIILFSPWPIRNWAETGQPHFVTLHYDRFSRPQPNQAGYKNWMATWARTDGPLRGSAWCFFDPTCAPRIDTYPPEAFQTEDDRKRVAALLARRDHGELSPEMSREFDAIARANRARHPLAFVELVLDRAVWQWVNPHNDVYGNPRWWPWPEMTRRLLPKLERLAELLAIAWLLAGAILLASRLRWSAAVLLTAIVTRTLMLAWFYLPEGRYILEVVPAAIVLICAAPTVLLSRLRRPAVLKST